MRKCCLKIFPLPSVCSVMVWKRKCFLNKGSRGNTGSGCRMQSIVQAYYCESKNHDVHIEKSFKSSETLNGRTKKL